MHKKCKKERKVRTSKRCYQEIKATVSPIISDWSEINVNTSETPKDYSTGLDHNVCFVLTNRSSSIITLTMVKSYSYMPIYKILVCPYSFSHTAVAILLLNLLMN